MILKKVTFLIFLFLYFPFLRGYEDVFPFIDQHALEKEEKNLPNDSIFPRIKPEIIGTIYHMLKVIDFILVENSVPYWIDGGVLLGAVRHGGLIPWDDDGDIEILTKDWPLILSLEGQFKSFGYEFKGENRLKPVGKSYPIIDFMFTKVKGKKVVLEFWPGDVWPNNWFYVWEIFPAERIQVGPIFLQAPKNPLRYLKAQYGKECMKYALCWQHDEKEFTHMEKVEVIDFKPADFVEINPLVPLKTTL